MKMKICYLYRKSKRGFFSIENVFEIITSYISKYSNVTFVEMKNTGAKPFVLIKNLIAFKKDKKQIYHITGDIHYMALVTKKPTILTVHDVGSALQGSFLKRIYIRILWFWIPSSIVNKITVISEFTKNELEKIIPRAKNKIRVIPNPVNPKFAFSPKDFNSNTPQILIVGTKENKNLIRIFKAVKDIPCKLHIIGNLQKKQLSFLQEYKINYKNSVGISVGQIINAYRNCDLLCFPSTYEGFGMPIIEAQATGRAVLTSKLGAMKEVANNSACLVNPFDCQSIREGLVKIIKDEQYRNELVAKGQKNVKRFELANVGAQYLALYKEIIS